MECTFPQSEVSLGSGASESPVSETKTVQVPLADEGDMAKEDIEGIPSSKAFYAPIDTSARASLHRIATHLAQRQHSYQSSASEAQTDDLEHNDTLTGLELGDPALDPSSEMFDSYKWARMMVRMTDEEGVKIRRAGFRFKNLNVSGSGSALNLQKNVGSLLLAPFRMSEHIRMSKGPEKQILRNFNGVVKSGEMLIVLGRPGSGCSTLLKTICGELQGLSFQEGSDINYNGITQEQMVREFRGEVVYNQETEKHFPHLTVGETLEFAASARTPHNRLRGATRGQLSKYLAQVVMAMFGLSHTYNTKVGNDFVRGVSGGERKRVSIAEMALARAPIAAWDNSTRGLDAATALEFVQSLRMSSDLTNTSHVVAIYQASQAIYEIFDKAVVLYEGREIYFGRADHAQAFFEEQGWYNPPRQTTGDFLTSVTNPQERRAKEGMENKVPRTPDEFERYWKNSEAFRELQREIKQHEKDFPVGCQAVNEFRESKVAQQAHHVRPTSPYLISIPMQVRLCTKRAYQRIWNDKTSTLTTVIGQVIFALIIGSIFFGTPDSSSGFFAKGAALFFAVLLNALISISEINTLYAQRPIVEKHASYAFYHPFAEALAGIVSDIPVKFLIAVGFNVILYFLAGLRYEPSQFFIYFIFVFLLTLTMSGMFRTVAAATATISQALAVAGVLVLGIVIYTGFVIKLPDMHPWFKWISYINPVRYGFEALIANEFHGRNFSCAAFVPTYPDLSGDQFICAIAGAVQGQRYVSGDAFIESSYDYTYAHVWRNFGIIVAFFIFFETVYLVATEVNSATSSTAEFLVFRRGHVPAYMQNFDKKKSNDESVEARLAAAAKEGSQSDEVNAIPAQKDIFTWRDVAYTIPVKKGERKLLDNVSGWVKPGTLTALMGVSGAGKTTLLDVLAQRVSVGVVTGDMLVNGKPRDTSFPRKTGYVQQQDLHLETSTVREALRFSAMLRQPKSVSKLEKFDYVEEVIKMLNMEDFAEAVVGQPGEGLNVEQRKLLTIGVELAAKPALLLFLDEPTSGLDSQSSWAICAFLRKLADNGQAVLSTIHQPSAILFQEFDRLLFLAKGGKTVYFGNIGEQSRILLNYFESHGARKCEDTENPAEYMLEVVGAGASGKAAQDWPSVWKESQQARDVQAELNRIHEERVSEACAGEDGDAKREFAMPFGTQLYYVISRVFQQYWRMPSYIYGKFMLGIASALFIGFSFYKQNGSQAGVQNILFSVFMLTTIFSTLVQQVMPRFIIQRDLYEVRERPSKAYSWAAFIMANIVVEIPYQILLGVVVWAAYYYPIFGTAQSPERQGLILFYAIQFFVFASTFAHLVISALPDSGTAGNIATLMFAMTLAFDGVMQSPSNLPGFWIFMYRVSPLTYLVSGMTCGNYMASYLRTAPGTLQNPSATSDCAYCSFSNADQFLASSEVLWSTRWRNLGIGFAYIVFNIFGAVVLYYSFRVRRVSIKPDQILNQLKRLKKIVSDKSKGFRIYQLVKRRADV